MFCLVFNVAYPCVFRSGFGHVDSTFPHHRQRDDINTVCVTKNFNTVIHPSIFFCSSGAGSRGQQPEQGRPDFPLPRHLLQLFQEDPKAFPGQPSDVVTPACPGSSPGSPPGGTCLEYPPREAYKGHLIQMPEPPQLAPLDVEEQRLYSELLPGDRAPHPISKGARCHPTEEKMYIFITIHIPLFAPRTDKDSSAGRPFPFPGGG